jgi:hypothetical protein
MSSQVKNVNGWPNCRGIFSGEKMYDFGVLEWQVVNRRKNLGNDSHLSIIDFSRAF